jgi:tetratricopeptide (TPR) repeat protein
MRGLRLLLTAVLCLAVAGAARAGVYCSLDNLQFPVPPAHKDVKSLLGGVRSVRNAEKKEEQLLIQKKYKAAAEALEEKAKAGQLPVEAVIELSGLYLRLGYDGKAVALLDKADQDHFLVRAHLAVASHNQGQLNRAIKYQQQALDIWPKEAPGFTPEQLAWYRRVERYYLEFLRLRYQDMLRGKQPGDAVDALFPHLRFDTAEGRYELGGPPVDSPAADAIPLDAVALMAQLVWWVPFDNHLYWLYGEVRNYRGDVVGAEDVLTELTTITGTRRMDRNNYPTANRHAQALFYGKQLLGFQRDLLWMLHPRLPGAAPGGDLPAEMGGLFAADRARYMEDNRSKFFVPPVSDKIPSGPETTPTVPPTAPQTASWLPDWRTVVVSFAAGMIVMALLSLQVREWQRRRALRESGLRQLTR